MSDKRRKENRYIHKHLLTPIDALNVIDRLHKAVPNATSDHVAFALGMSRGQLSKEVKHLALVVAGNEDACKNYNTRRSFMRQLFLWDNSTEITLKHVMNDAMIFGGNGNIASKRGRKEESEMIIGVSETELEAMRKEIVFIDANEVKMTPLKLLCKNPDHYKSKPVQQRNDNLNKDYKYIRFCEKRGLKVNSETSKQEFEKFNTQLQLMIQKQSIKIIKD